MTRMLWDDDESFSKESSLSPIQSKKAIDEPGSTSDSPLSVNDLNLWIAAAIEANIPKVWIEGEITDLSQPRSGHVYFGLKDATAQIRAVLWRSTAERVKFKLQDGQAVLAYGRVDLYSPRGSYQLVVERIEPQGIGSLQLAFQQLFDRLSQEGLFNPEHKRPLPRFPKRIGFVTSPSGAAIQDFLEVLRRRWRGTDVLIIPSRVQGEGAAQEIAAGIAIAQRIVPRLDCLVVGRGGGSMEDLWCFNEELVVRAMAASEIPTISAVGHEIDVTLCDLVADVRALTPSEAAELVVPSEVEISSSLTTLRERIDRAMQSKLDRCTLAVDSLANRPVLVRPEEIFIRPSQRLDELQIRSERAIDRLLELYRSQLASRAAALDALSPLKTLHRGYSVSRTINDSGFAVIPLTHVEDLKVGGMVHTMLANGNFESRVTRITKEHQ